jgi:O-antigen/teichoic acid export membrane protein
MSHKRKVLLGSASNLIRVTLSMLVSLVLPPFLVHRLPTAEYGAWVLILQMSGYVGLLDLGLQTAIAKFVAEYEARGDRQASHRVVSTSFSILCIAGTVASLAVAGMVWAVPRLFPGLPLALVSQVRIALLAVGLSTAIALPFGSFLATFTGLQQYIFPTALATFTRVGSAAALIALLLRNHGLVAMALAMAAFSLAGATIQFFGWRKLVRERVSFSFLFFHRQSAAMLVKYGSVLSVWSVAMLFVSGLDVVIVGHYRYPETGFYSVANNAGNFMLLVVSSVFGPLVPAVSSLQVRTTAEHVGELCTRLTRYCTLLLCLLGLPLLVCGYPLLTAWVGSRYAAQSWFYLQVLVLGNAVRQLMLPYILMVVATGKQHLATIAAINEACINLIVSIWLVQRIGAVGVAVGTLVGAFVSVGTHLLVSVPRTRGAILIHRPSFVTQGLLRPLLVITPAMLLYPFWRKLSLLPAPPGLLAIWIVLTGCVAWWVVLTEKDRQELLNGLRRLISRRSPVKT